MEIGVRRCGYRDGEDGADIRENMKYMEDRRERKKFEVLRRKFEWIW